MRSIVLEDSCWAIIPARGGSEGVKGKNIKVLGGKPLIGYSIEALKKANVFNKIVVTSDCDEILSTAKSFGADVYLRTDPDESNSIVMPDIPVLSYLESLKPAVRPKFCMMVQCTAPFVMPDSYQNAYKLLQKNQGATIFAAHVAHSFLWQRETETDVGSRWLAINHPFSERVGRQYSKVQQVNETGAFYGFPVREFMSARHRFFSVAFPVIIEGDELIDINDNSDWDFAQFKVKNREC